MATERNFTKKHGLPFDLPRHLRYGMTLDLFSGTWSWRYRAEGKDGALEYWARTMAYLDKVDEAYGGIEMHSATATSNKPPDHGECIAISRRPCWHDGSSLQAEEWWLPLWMADPNDHASVFRRLAEEYDKRFGAPHES